MVHDNEDAGAGKGQNSARLPAAPDPITAPQGCAMVPGPGGASLGPRVGTPEWAGALRRMYDAVVDEPLPEGIAELLARLDTQSGAQGA